MRYFPRFLLAVLILACTACGKDTVDTPAAADHGYIQFVWELDGEVEVAVQTTRTDFTVVRGEEEFLGIGRANRQRYDFAGPLPEGRYVCTVRRTDDTTDGVLVEAKVSPGVGGTGGVGFSVPFDNDTEEVTFSLIVEGTGMRYEE